MADKKRDYYEVLGLKKDASESDIKKAYRRLAKEHHPDVNPGNKEAEAKFKELNEAYEILSDSDKKAKYDQFGHAAFDPTAGGYSGYSGGAGFGGFGDIFGDLFNGFGDIFTGGARSAQQRGENIKAFVNVSFEEAAFGCTKEIAVNRVEPCAACSGTGAARGTSPETCSNCNGTGAVRTQQRVMGMSVQSTASCPKCGGTGKIIKTPCPECGGSTITRKPGKVTISIPAGIDDGQTISMRGRGNAGKNNAPAGDLLITVGVRPHPTLKRDGNTIHCDATVTLAQAILGAELEVQTLDGKVAYSIPEGTQSGTVFRLKNKGVPYLHGNGRGDQYVTVRVNIPKGLNDEQKDLLRKLDASLNGEPIRQDHTDRKRKKKIL